MNKNSPVSLGAVEFLLAGGLMLAYWSMLASTPSADWNSARLYPTFLLSEGISPYSPADVGPVTGWIYGPIMPLVHLPATWAGDLTVAMLISALINATALLAPMALLVNQAARQNGLAPRERLAGWLIFFGMFPLIPVLRGFLCAIVCDEVAIAATILSCWALVDTTAVNTGRLLVAAFFAVTAIWTKQIEIVVPAAQLAYLWVTDTDSLRFRRYLLCLLGVGAAYAGAMIGWFGLDPLVFNLWIVPQGHSLKGWPEFAKLSATFAVQVLPAIAIILGLEKLTRSGKHRPVPQPGRIVGLLVVVGTALIPLNLLGAGKVGGGLNSLHALALFFAAAMVSVVRALPILAEIFGMARLRVLSWAVALAGILGIGADQGFRIFPAPHLDAQLEIARAHPRQVYFPGNPLVTWWTDHQAYHHEYGLMDQAISGYPVSRKRYFDYLPPDLRLIVYHNGGSAELAPQVISGLTRVNSEGRFTVYQRARPKPLEGVDH